MKKKKRIIKKIKIKINNKILIIKKIKKNKSKEVYIKKSI